MCIRDRFMGIANLHLFDEYVWKEAPYPTRISFDFIFLSLGFFDNKSLFGYLPSEVVTIVEMEDYQAGLPEINTQTLHLVQMTNVSFVKKVRTEAYGTILTVRANSMTDLTSISVKNSLSSKKWLDKSCFNTDWLKTVLEGKVSINRDDLNNTLHERV
eukprot:TRINITY_DN8253_c0_g1_i2.p1 TRINITY_DN8253_c0_g1~~TRINITY_DN8253_c0_g1_i2.p1  ORF type:complete len:158 (+),score=35.76 TRINITY_DN8253_c0_g1_i2:64-537(+)